MSKLNIEDIFVGETLYAGDYDEVVTVHLIDEDNGKVYCADETFGVSMWYDLDVLKKIDDEPEEAVLDDEFLAFAKALEAVAKFNGIDVPQVEIDEEPNVINDYDDYDDYEDLLDERYDPNRSPEYKFNFYNALEELQFQYVNEDRNVIWYMTNGERALTFKDDRLVDVRLSEHVENFVYFSAPIHIEDLLDEWEVRNIVDEEIRKIQEIAALAESLHNESLMIELLEVIGEYL